MSPVEREGFEQTLSPAGENTNILGTMQRTGKCWSLGPEGQGSQRSKSMRPEAFRGTCGKAAADVGLGGFRWVRQRKKGNPEKRRGSRKSRK
jgi:hypothetical protein